MGFKKSRHEMNDRPEVVANPPDAEKPRLLRLPVVKYPERTGSSVSQGMEMMKSGQQGRASGVLVSSWTRGWCCVITLGLMTPAIPAADPPASQPAATALEQCEIYPLAVGSLWIYKSGPLEVREKVVRHEEMQGEMCARIETIFDDRVVSFEHVAVRADGIYRVAVGGTPIDPPLKFVSLPVRPGDKWTVDSKIAGKPIRGEFTTSEGTFQARSPRGDQDQSLKTHHVAGQKFQTGGETVSFSYDFVPQIGKVKQTAKAHGLETAIELNDFLAPGQSPTRSASGKSLLLR
jgi:hypothetical protein